MIVKEVALFITITIARFKLADLTNLKEAEEIFISLMGQNTKVESLIKEKTKVIS